MLRISDCVIIQLKKQLTTGVLENFKNTTKTNRAQASPRRENTDGIRDQVVFHLNRYDFRMILEMNDLLHRNGRNVDTIAERPIRDHSEGTLLAVSDVVDARRHVTGNTGPAASLILVGSEIHV